MLLFFYLIILLFSLLINITHSYQSFFPSFFKSCSVKYCMSPSINLQTSNKAITEIKLTPSSKEYYNSYLSSSKCLVRLLNMTKYI